jgi:two-component system, response regulator
MGNRAVEILLVEDNPADAELTLHALRKSNLANNIQIAHDGEEALDFLFCRGAHSHRSFLVPKLVLLDLKLPKVDGAEVLQAIRDNMRTKQLPVVVLTSSKEQQDVTKMYRLGATSYIQKPVDFEQFQRTIRQIGFYWLVVNEPLP